MKQRLYACIVALLITLVVGAIVLIPLTYIGFIIFPTETRDGRHHVMPIGAILFGMVTTAIVCLTTLYYSYIMFHKRYYKNRQLKRS